MKLEVWRLAGRGRLVAASAGQEASAGQGFEVGEQVAAARSHAETSCVDSFPRQVG